MAAGGLIPGLRAAGCLGPGRRTGTHDLVGGLRVWSSCRTVVVRLAEVQTGRVVGGCVSDRLRVPSAGPVRELRNRIGVLAGALAGVADRYVASIRYSVVDSRVLESPDRRATLEPGGATCGTTAAGVDPTDEVGSYCQVRDRAAQCGPTVQPTRRRPPPGQVPSAAKQPPAAT